MVQKLVMALIWSQFVILDLAPLCATLLAQSTALNAQRFVGIRTPMVPRNVTTPQLEIVRVFVLGVTSTAVTVLAFVCVFDRTGFRSGLAIKKRG